MELLDVYDINRNKTGRIVERGKGKINPGEFFLVTEILMINNEKKILIGKRSNEKKLHPGMWEINGGGCQSGETSKEAIVREIKEELGIELEPNKLELLKIVRNEIRFKDIWTYSINIDLKDLKFQDNEVTDAMWVSYDEFEEKRKNNELIDTSNISKEDYEKAIELLNI
ncbi:MAG: NUDIX domain-containing protein [Clostridia bacterium]|nr:NUDIX domain-containing protein [Clostridia bacterium]